MARRSQAWLHENCYDLHYEPTPGAQPFSFGVGNLWRIAVQYPGCPRAGMHPSRTGGSPTRVGACC